jgi:hypothetical protein
VVEFTEKFAQTYNQVLGQGFFMEYGLGDFTIDPDPSLKLYVVVKRKRAKEI